MDDLTSERSFDSQATCMGPWLICYNEALADVVGRLVQELNVYTEENETPYESMSTYLLRLIYEKVYS